MDSNSNNKKFWKSLSEYNNEPEILKNKRNEFSEGVTEDFEPSELSGMSRRKFIAIMGAATAITATACSDYRDKGEIIPYNKRPEEVLPGTANYYASTCTGCESLCGILVKTREGRPIKIDGNPDHPVNKGKICAKGQAEVTNLYDPTRIKEPLFNKRKASWEQIDNQLISEFKKANEEGLEIALISEHLFSPTFKKLLDEFKAKYPTAKEYYYSASDNGNKLNAWYKSFGNYSIPTPRYDKAELVLALDDDFLGVDGNSIENTKNYSRKRDAIDKVNFNRLYVIEGRMSLTGMMSDYRMRLRPDAQLELVWTLINELKNNGSIAIPAELSSKVSGYNLTKFVSIYKINEKKLRSLLTDLSKAKGKSIITVGKNLSESVHISVNYLNELLNNSGNFDNNNFDLGTSYASYKELESLVSKMESGKVGVVINLDVNPLFNLPVDLGFEKAYEKIKTTVAFTQENNETSEKSKYLLPINHFLESWGDYQNKAYVMSLQQPVINPLFNTRQKEAIFLTWVNGDTKSYNVNSYHKYLLENFDTSIYNNSSKMTDSKSFWYGSLHDGIVELKTTVNSKGSFNNNALSSISVPSERSKYCVYLTESYFLGGGKYANNGWLQETPHPVTKITWDNYVSVSPATANQFGIEKDDLLEISVNNKKLKIAAIIQPGLADDVLHIEFGNGRKVVGDVGLESGVNAFELISKNNGESNFVLTGAEFSKTGESYKLASTQEHHSLDDTFVKDFHKVRKIIQEGTVNDYIKEPHFLHEDKHEIFSITDEHKYTEVKWAMAIDLNKCTSCGGCVTACNVENNVPVVGKDQVLYGREMQWMRIDRYYSGTPNDPEVSNQPMLCQHCDNAPCENVCPVNATNHSPDGLNQMAYNRCVGTRYCANNCPYKVRRFNYFNFRDHFADSYYENDLTPLGNNPEVTVRSRGVMEKCTFCVQKIMDARQLAIKEERPLNGNDVVTACQQACPAEAIVFGDSNDPDSKISKYRKHNLAYHVL
ncbi:MAG: TAT-variant-translocated molybdopterin oxidoreductase, partial [Melioribacteraceae bacterium]|nr:TAT-variant-translocated molybdopterin oxidoreductase [Melioribacteraceae bacterium]